MKNKTISLLILGLAAVFASSCEKSSDVRGTDGQPTFKIRLSIDGNMTKTSGTSYLADETSESAISSLRLFLVSDDADKTIHELVSGTDFTQDDDDPMLLNAYLAPNVYEGDWLAFAVANWPSNITLDTSTYAGFTGSYSNLTDAQLAGMWASGSFPMVNLGGGVSVHLAKTGVSLTPEAEITLERIAAKVRASVDPYITYGILGTEMGSSTAVFGVSRVVFDGIAMINNVRSFNLIQQWTAGGSLVSPSSASSYPLSSTGYYNTTVPPASWSTPGTVMYCLENNAPDYVACGGTHLDASEGTRMKGRVTGLLIRAKVETLSFFKSEADTDPDDPDYGENLILDPDPGMWTSRLMTKAPETDAAFRTFYKYKGVYFADYQQLFAQNPSLGSTAADADAGLLRSKGVSVYENGYMYYTYWIETEGDQYVARNVFYDLAITSVNAFGDELPGGVGYSAADPLKTDDPKLTVALTIADWDEKSNQDYTL